tara:strand:+ start:1459 stop:2061 length:603 start_codon:yes stop_codon:yes gene_type:complete
MAYSYTGVFPNQQLKNSGVFTVADALNLESIGEWGGSIELIQTQTISSGSTMNFTSIKESKYDVHMLQAKNCESSSASTSISVRLSNDGGSSYEAGTSYQIALQYGTTGASFGEVNNTGTSYMQFMGDNQNQNRGGYMYLYNLGNSAKYSHSTYQQMTESVMSFGGSAYTTAETINAIQVLTTNTNAWTGTVELYGVKQI